MAYERIYRCDCGCDRVRDQTVKSFWWVVRITSDKLEVRPWNATLGRTWLSVAGEGCLQKLVQRYATDAAQQKSGSGVTSPESPGSSNSAARSEPAQRQTPILDFGSRTGCR